MSDIVDIHIDFTRPGPARRFRFVSRIIRWIQGTPYSHVLLRWTSRGTGVECIYEAGGTSVRFMGPLAAAGQYEIVRSYKLTITRAEYRELIRVTHHYAGVDYGVKQLIGQGLVHLFRLGRNPFADGRSSFVCSEMVIHILEEVFGLHTGLNPEIDGPREIQKYLDEIGDY